MQPILYTICDAVQTDEFKSAIRAAIERVLAVELPEPLPRWAERYAQVGPRNAVFLWRFVVRGLEFTKLSSVDPELGRAVLVTKVLGVMLDVLLDDIADCWQDAAMLEQALAIPLGQRPSGPETRPGAGAYLALTADVWAEIQQRIQSFPRYREFAPLLNYDYAQLFNTMRYALLVNRQPSLLNMVENELYQPHNMHMMISSTMDLMASPSFDVSELGLLREVVWRAQRMGRIGNQISTWEREIKDRDYTSEVFAYALQRGILTLDLLKDDRRSEILRRLHNNDLEAFFLLQWERLHDEIVELSDRIRSVDVMRLVRGLEELIKLHLGSKGLK